MDESLSPGSDRQKKGRWAAASGLGVCFATTTGTRHEFDDSSFWTLRPWQGSLGRDRQLFLFALARVFCMNNLL